MSELSNTVYDDIQVGQRSSYSKTFTEDMLVLFAEVSGDLNPVHLDNEFAATTMFKERIAHGAWTSSVISAALGSVFPGPGSIYRKQEVAFLRPVKVGDTITVTLEVLEKNDKSKALILKTDVVNQHGKAVASGIADVIAPVERCTVPSPVLPSITINR